MLISLRPFARLSSGNGYRSNVMFSMALRKGFVFKEKKWVHIKIFQCVSGEAWERLSVFSSHTFRALWIKKAFWMSTIFLFTGWNFKACCYIDFAHLSPLSDKPCVLPVGSLSLQSPSLGFLWSQGPLCGLSPTL